MKRLIVLLLALVMTFSLVACGGKETPNNPDNNPSQLQSGENKDNKDGTEVKDVNADNWTEVLSKDFGLELTLPDGWSVKSVESPNGVSNIKLFLNVGGSTTYADYGETLFNELKKDATGDIQSLLDSTVYASFSEACSGTIAGFKANVNGEGFGTLAINYYDNDNNVEFTFTKY